MTRLLRIGTRGSALALAQAHWVRSELQKLGQEVEITIIQTTGDKVLDRSLFAFSGKGIFVKEIEQALLEERVDLAVHSMKDLPSENPPELVVAAVPEREIPFDALVGPLGRSVSLASLPQGAIVGTSSLRRRSLLTDARPDLQLVDVRGNVDTRLRKLDGGEFAALVMAEAGLRRLGLAARVSERISAEKMVPAPAQGALALQCRVQDAFVRELLLKLHHGPTGRAVEAERALMQALGGGCAFPLGAYAVCTENSLTLRAAMAEPGTGAILRAQVVESTAAPLEVARQALTQLRSRRP